MIIEGEQDGTQAASEGETVENRDNNAAPEQDNDELDIDNGEGGDEGQEGSEAAAGGEEGEGEKAAKPEKKKQPWELRRISELTAKQREAERRAEAAEAELARLRKKPADTPDDDTPASPDEVRRQVREEIRAEEIGRNDAANYKKRVDTWAESGVRDFGDDFHEKCNIVAMMGGADRPEFMQTLTDPDVVEDGHKVVMALADDTDEAERILALPPVKMAIALAKLSAKVAKPGTPAPKALSKAPAPVTPIGGRAAAPSRIDDPDVPMDKFAEEFLKQMANRGH